MRRTARQVHAHAFPVLLADSYENIGFLRVGLCLGVWSKEYVYLLLEGPIYERH